MPTFADKEGQYSGDVVDALASAGGTSAISSMYSSVGRTLLLASLYLIAF